MIATRNRAAKFRVVLDTDKMRELRLKLGLSMEEAATRAGFASRQRWYEIESGRGNRTNIKIETLNAIAAALQVKGKDLLK